jgi:anti-sigma factor RsiW
MACEVWGGKLDVYLDGELPVADERVLRVHLRTCAACAADALDRQMTKRAIQAAGQRFVPSAAFRSRMEAQIRANAPASTIDEKRSPAKSARLGWSWFPAFAAIAALVMIAGLFAYNRDRVRESQLTSELVDMHVAMLASPNPVDVVSTDRHTVKPWFAGKIPFTFNLPELEGSPFVLAGGRVSYLHQSPGAELIFKVRQHQISVFVFQERALDGTSSNDTAAGGLSFGVRSWSRNGLRYFLVGDVAAEDLDKLSELLKAAG